MTRCIGGYHVTALATKALKSVTDASRFLTASTEIIQLLLELIMIRDGILNLYHPYTSLPKSFFDIDEIRHCILTVCTE
jgi:hypothetical protein